MGWSTGRLSLCVVVMFAALGTTPGAAACYPGLGDCADGGKPKPVPLPTQPAPPAPQPPPQQNQQPAVQYYYVGPVFPPDPWLALRSQPSSKAGYQITKMAEGTTFRLLATRGPWYQVELRDGTTGWAHSSWIRCCKSAP